MIVIEVQTRGTERIIMISWLFSASAGTSDCSNVDACPVKKNSKLDNASCIINQRNMMITNLETEENQGLGKERVLSSIPRTTQDTEEETNWMYPSPHMFYNAMRKKGYDPQAEDMNAVVNIHNMVNEQCWNKVLQWEALDENSNVKDNPPKLDRFLGRPNDWTPRAWFRHYVLGYKAPFDRHDWFVETNGEVTRYVIDFYSGNDKNSTMSFHLDVRPALDSWKGVSSRFRMFMHRNFCPIGKQIETQ